MKFLIDECVGPFVAQWLKQRHYDVVSIYDDFPSIDDYEVLEKSLIENRILITHDKDFGEIIFKNKGKHVGVLFLKIIDQRPEIKIKIIEMILEKHSHDLPGNFVTVTEGNIRISKAE